MRIVIENYFYLPKSMSEKIMLSSIELGRQAGVMFCLEKVYERSDKYFIFVYALNQNN